MMSIRKTSRGLSDLLESALRFIGTHPLAVLVWPSVWFMSRYLPFWKDADVLVQLVWPISADNVLVCPPLYCFLGRIPFWVTDTAISGRAPGIFSPQHPSLAAVYALIICQHVGLWLALRYFLFSVPASASGRGLTALLLASVASFYSFAHTAGAEAIYAMTWFPVFGAGIRLLRGDGSWKTWGIYGAALFLAIGSRHISGLLLGWLPVTSVVLIGLSWFSVGSLRTVQRISLFKVAIIALVLSASSLTAERLAVAGLCRHFGITARNILG